MTWQYSNPVRIIFTDAFHEKLGAVIGDKSDILIVCSNRFRQTDSFSRIKSALPTAQCFTDIENNPSFDSCQRAIEFASSFEPKVIVAIGGGSVIDTAKAVRMAVYKSCYLIQELFQYAGEPLQKPLFIAAPTTHGSGSEMTMWATIWDKTDKVKHSLSEYSNYPDYALFDASLVSSLPLSVSISSTLDALSHSLEALWNKNSNPVSDHFATEAIMLIMNSLDELAEPIPLEVRGNLLMASMYAGLAFSNTKTAAAHSISYPLTAYFNIPHGIACSMSLYSLFKINRKQMQHWPNLLQRIQLNSFEELWGKVLDLVDTRVPFTLHEYSVARDDLNWLTDMAFSKGRMENNIVDLSRDDVMKILNDII